MKNWTVEDETIILNVLRTLQRKNKQKKTYFDSSQLIISYEIIKGLPRRKYKKDLNNPSRKNQMHGIQIQPIVIGRICSYLNNNGLLGALGRETRHITWELTDNIFKEPIEGRKIE